MSVLFPLRLTFASLRSDRKKPSGETHRYPRLATSNEFRQTSVLAPERQTAHRPDQVVRQARSISFRIVGGWGEVLVATHLRAAEPFRPREAASRPAIGGLPVFQRRSPQIDQPSSGIRLSTTYEGPGALSHPTDCRLTQPVPPEMKAIQSRAKKRSPSGRRRSKCH